MSALEYLQTSQLREQVSTLNARISEIEPGGQVLVGVSQSFSQTGQIVIDGLGTFDFRAANYTAPNTFNFENVTFTSTPEVTTGALCAQFQAILQNGSTYSLAACAFDVSTPSSGSPVQQAVIAFTNETTPHAGVMLLPDRTAYVLVRA